MVPETHMHTKFGETQTLKTVVGKAGKDALNRHSSVKAETVRYQL